MPTSVAMTGCSPNKFSRTEEENNSTSRVGQHLTKFDWQWGLAARARASGHAVPPHEELAPLHGCLKSNIPLLHRGSETAFRMTAKLIGQCLNRVSLGHPAASLECPVCAKADIAERRATPSLRSAASPRQTQVTSPGGR